MNLTILDSARRHLLNIPGKRLTGRYVVFESDDWGSERIPAKDSINYLTSLNIDIFNNPFNSLDSLETENDLIALFDLLLRFRDRNGNHPTITANTITSNPDFIKIKASDFNEYYYESTLQTYEKKKSCLNSFKIIKQGISEGIYHPQFHGREHLNVKQWLHSLKTGHRVLRKAFDVGIYGIDIETEITRRNNFMAAFDISSMEDITFHENVIRDGTKLFAEMFGYMSKSFIAPCFIWHPLLEPMLKENGICYIQGLPVQYIPNYGRDYRKKYHYQGEKNRIQQAYFIRNCFFEPAMNNKFNWIEDSLKRMQIIFKWGKPAIFGIHRINFMGSLNEENRRRNLQDFSRLLESILEKWPDIQFTTTDRLGQEYFQNNE